MFQSPFDDLGKGKPEEVTGEFQCFTCFDTVADAAYNIKTKTLFYTCVNGHETKLEGYRLE